MFRLQGTYKKENPRHDGTIDLTNDEKEGWSDPTAHILIKMKRDIGPSRPPKIRQYPLYSGQTHIPATLKGTDWQVASTVEAIIRTFASDWKIEMDSANKQTQEPDLIH